MAEPKPRWDLQPPPPNDYVKIVEYSREVKMTECAAPGCCDLCDKERMLCDDHYYELVRRTTNVAKDAPAIRELAERVRKVVR